MIEWTFVMNSIRTAGGVPYETGGSVRDKHVKWFMLDSELGIPHEFLEPSDYDIEVFDLDLPAIAQAVKPFAKGEPTIDEDYRTVKIQTKHGMKFDFNMPRTERKVGPGHRGFRTDQIETHDLKTASVRRDFTVNAIMMDPNTGDVFDFHGGRNDLKRRVLRHVSPAFVEDALRPIRALQFAGRYDMIMHPETVAMCRSMHSMFSELPVERIREEWLKWAHKSVRPSAGLWVLHQTGWLQHFPELFNLQGIEQNPKWHPEGDVWMHTLQVVDAAANIATREELSKDERIILVLAALVHDLGKMDTTTLDENRRNWVSPGHAEDPGGRIDSFFERINLPNKYRIPATALAKKHMAPTSYSEGISKRAVRRLSLHLSENDATLPMLALLVEADCSGRPPDPPCVPEQVVEMLELAREMQIDTKGPEPILLGRHLITRGLKPGIQFGAILDAAFQAQLDGAFEDLDGALKWLDDYLRPGYNA